MRAFLLLMGVSALAGGWWTWNLAHDQPQVAWVYYAYTALAVLAAASVLAIRLVPSVRAGTLAGDGLAYAAAYWVGVSVLQVSMSHIAGNEWFFIELGLAGMCVLASWEQRELEEMGVRV